MYDAPGHRIQVVFPGQGPSKTTPIPSSTFAVVDNKVLYLVKTKQPTRWDKPDSSNVLEIQPGELCVGTLGGVHEVLCAGALSHLSVGDKLWINSSDGLNTLILATSGGTGGADANEVQSVKVQGTGGFFKLKFGEDETANIKWNASAVEVQAALEALPSINPGDVTVTGGPGNEAGSTPYTVTFGGRLEKTDVAQLTATDTLTGGEEKVTVSTSTAGAGSSDISLPVGVVDEIDATRTPHVARINANALHAFIQG